MSAPALPIQETAQLAPQPITKPQETSELRMLYEIADSTQKAQIAGLMVRQQDFAFQQRLAKLFSKSGMFGQVKNLSEEEAIAQAMVKIELGASMGFSPAESMMGIHVIQGQAAISAALRAARMQASGYDWDVEFLGDDGRQGCTVWLRRGGKPMVDRQGGQISVSFTADDAHANGLLGKDNWKKNPRNMYFARAITNAQRFYAPAVLNVNLLSVEEAQDLDNTERPPAPVAVPVAMPRRRSETKPDAETKPTKVETKAPEPETPEHLTISDAQAIGLYEVAKKNGLDQDEVDACLKEMGFSSILDIPANKYPALIATIGREAKESD